MADNIYDHFGPSAAPMETPSVTPMQEEKPGMTAATSIVWGNTTDAGVASDFGETPETAPQNVNVEGKPKVQVTDDLAAGTTKETAMKSLDGKVEPKLANSLSAVIGDSTGLADAISRLDKGIEKQEGKRDSVKLMMAGLALLSGEGFSGAARIANSVGDFNKQRIDQLYGQRKLIQNSITKKALNSAGLGGSATGLTTQQTFSHLDKNNYTTDSWSKAVTSGDVSQLQMTDGSKLTKWDTSGLTEAQGKSLALGNEAITGHKRLEALENSGLVNPGSVGTQLAQAIVRDGEGNVTGLNQAVLDAMDPLHADYLYSMMKYITAKLRKESGAAISASEWSSETAKLIPRGKANTKEIQKERARGIKGLVNTSGAPSAEDYYKANGFDEGTKFNQDNWLTERLQELGKSPVTKVETSDGGSVSVKDLLKGRK